MTTQRMGGSHLAPREVLPVADGEQEVRAGRLSRAIGEKIGTWPGEEALEDGRIMLEALAELGFLLVPR